MENEGFGMSSHIIKFVGDNQEYIVVDNGASFYKKLSDKDVAELVSFFYKKIREENKDVKIVMSELNPDLPKLDN